MSTKSPTGKFRAHIQEHIAAVQKKQQEGMQTPKGYPGIPGSLGGGGPPGVAGTPRPGAVPEGPRNGQNPPGAINPEQMQDAQAQMAPQG